MILHSFSVFCLDAKIRFDDNADFRQKEVFAQRDWTQEDPSEVEAANYNLNYIYNKTKMNSNHCIQDK